MSDELPDDPREWTEKQLLIEVNNQLGALRQQNQRLINILSDDSGGDDQYKCLSCGDHVEKDERDSHQIRKHSAPPEGVDLTGEYSPL